MKKPVPVLGEGATAKLIRYSWPGNIRELENVMERAVNLMEGPMVLAQHVLVQGVPTLAPTTVQRNMQTRLEDAVAETERETILQALQLYNSSRRMGEALGLSHTAVLKKLKKYGIALRPKDK